METAVSRTEIKALLAAAKTQFISISIANREGVWAAEYYSILDLKEFRNGNEKSLMIVLASNRNSECRMIEAHHIYYLRFNKLLHWKGVLLQEIALASEDRMRAAVERARL